MSGEAVISPQKGSVIKPEDPESRDASRTVVSEGGSVLVTLDTSPASGRVTDGTASQQREHLDSQLEDTKARASEVRARLAQAEDPAEREALQKHLTSLEKSVDAVRRGIDALQASEVAQLDPRKRPETEVGYRLFGWVFAR